MIKTCGNCMHYQHLMDGYKLCNHDPNSPDYVTEKDKACNKWLKGFKEK